MQASQIPALIPLPFANNGTKNPIPSASQVGITPGKASLTDGFPPLTFAPLASGGVPPSGGDFNGILNLITAVQQWQCAGGQFVYNLAFATAVGGYPKGAVLQSANGSTQWLCLLDGNTTDPDSGSAANWMSLASFGIAAVTGLTNANVTLSPAQYGKPVITLGGALTGNIQIIFPANQPLVRVCNNTTGGFTVTCKTAAGTGAAVAQGGQEEFFGDGANLVAILGNTAPQFDVSARLATMAALQRALGNASGFIAFAAGGAQALTAIDAGKQVILSGVTSGVLSLPLLATLPDGASFMIKNENGLATWTVAAAAGDGNAIEYAAGANATIPMLQDEYVLFVKGGALWRTHGVGVLRYSTSFASSKVANGFQKLPGGLIIQWGTGTISAGTGTIAFPIAFPTTVGALTTTSAGSGTSTSYVVNAASNVGVSGGTVYGTSAGGAASFSYNYIAIGW